MSGSSQFRLHWYHIYDVGAQCLRPPVSMFSNQKAKLLIIPIQTELISAIPDKYFKHCVAQIIQEN